MVRRLVVPALLLAACNGSSPGISDGGVDGGDGRVGQCAPGLKPHGPACIPIFDDYCKDDEVPLLGGGCKKVGVEECEIDGVPGIKGPPDWTCKRVGVEECVAAGGGPGIKGPPDWGCTAIGPPTTCLPGWAKTAGEWCEPILPSDPCPSGTMEVIGQKTCQPIGDCGTGAWGKIVTGATTIYVDESFVGGSSDGTAVKPYVTIGAAIAAAKSGAQIAIASGTYDEDVAIDKALVVEGRCPQLVRVKGVQATAALAVSKDGVEVRGLSVTGPQVGVQVQQAKALLERVVIAGCGGFGLSVAGGASVTLRDSLVAENMERGVEVLGSTATLAAVTVRDTLPPSEKRRAQGIGVHAVGGTPGSLAVADSVVKGNHGHGVWVVGSTATVDRTLIGDSREHTLFADSGDTGSGLLADASGTVVVRDSLVAANRFCGMNINASKATVERTVIRDTRSRTADADYGMGIYLIEMDRLLQTVVPSSLILRQSLVVNNRYGGVHVNGSSAEIDRTIVRDTKPSAKTGSFGHGVMTWGTKPLALTMRDSLVSGNSFLGIALNSSNATIRRTMVRDMARTNGDVDPPFLRGTALASYFSTVEIDACTTRNTAGGLVQVAGSAIIRDSILYDTYDAGDALTFQSFGVFAAAVETHREVDLTVQTSIIANTSGIGVVCQGYSVPGLAEEKQVSHAKLRVEGSIVRDTRAFASRDYAAFGLFGGGMLSWGRAEVYDTLVAGNGYSGIMLYLGGGVVERTIVRDTRSELTHEIVNRQAVDFELGAGIAVWGTGPTSVRESVAQRNSYVGMMITGDTTVERSVVRDTRVTTQLASGGAGIVIGTYADWPPPTVRLRETAVDGSLVMGVNVSKASATLERCVVGNTRFGRMTVWPESHDVFGHGDGIAADKAELHVANTLVERSSRTGLLFSASRGSARRSVLRFGVLAIDIEEAATPEIGDDNVFEGNVENRVTWGTNLAPSPTPKVPAPTPPTPPNPPFP